MNPYVSDLFETKFFCQIKKKLTNRRPYINRRNIVNGEFVNIEGKLIISDFNAKNQDCSI